MANEAYLGSIPPQTDAEVRITLKDRVGAVVTDATVTAKVYNPSGVLVTTANMSHTGSGIYLLSFDKAWSTSGTDAVIGQFILDVKAIRPSGTQRTQRYRLTTAYAGI